MFFFWGSILFVVLVGATNLYLGYAAAVFLGRGAQRWTEEDYAAATLGVVVQNAIGESDDSAGVSAQQTSECTPSQKSLQHLTQRCDTLIQGWKAVAVAMYANADAEDRIDLNEVRPQLENLWKEAAESDVAGEAFPPTLPDATAAFDIPQGIQAVEACFSSLTDETPSTDDNKPARQKCLDATNAIYNLRDRLHNAYRQELQCDAPSPGLYADQWEDEVHLWQGAADSKVASIGLIDIDLLEGLNEEHGPHAGDSVLDLVCETLSDLSHENFTSARISGQRFRLFSSRLDMISLAEWVEQVRQKLEKTTFLLSSGDFQATLSAAVLEIEPGEELDAAEQQLEKSIQEAKSYGRNRTFISENGYPTPVVPPDLSIKEQTIVLDAGELAGV